MKCPLNKAITYFDGKEYQVVMADCLHEECAWWDEENHWCAILSLTVELNGIHSEVDALTKMILERGKA